MVLPRPAIQHVRRCFYSGSLLLLLSSLVLLSNISIANADSPKRPQRVVSLNLCTDLLLMPVAAPGQIAALSDTAANPAYSPIAATLGETLLHGGRVEQIIALRPDLILAPRYMRGAAELLKRLGYPVTHVDLPESMSGIVAAVNELGKLLGQQQQAARVVAEFNAKRLAASDLFAGQRALVVGPNRYTSGHEGFKASLLTMAGLTNASPFEQASVLSLEQLIITNPDILIIDDSTQNQHSLAQSFKNHPALQKTLATGAIRQLVVDSSNWLCASPYAANIWQQLASAAND